MIKNGQIPAAAPISIPSVAAQEQTTREPESVFSPGRPPLVSRSAANASNTVFREPRQRHHSESSASRPPKVTTGFGLSAIIKIAKPQSSGASDSPAP